MTCLSNQPGTKVSILCMTASDMVRLRGGSKRSSGSFLNFNLKPSVMMFNATLSPRASHCGLREVINSSNLCLWLCEISLEIPCGEASLEKEPTENLVYHYSQNLKWKGCHSHNYNLDNY